MQFPAGTPLAGKASRDMPCVLCHWSSSNALSTNFSLDSAIKDTILIVLFVLIMLISLSDEGLYYLAPDLIARTRGCMHRDEHVPPGAFSPFQWT